MFAEPASSSPALHGSDRYTEQRRHGVLTQQLLVCHVHHLLQYGQAPTFPPPHLLCRARPCFGQAPAKLGLCTLGTRRCPGQLDRRSRCKFPLITPGASASDAPQAGAVVRSKPRRGTEGPTPTPALFAKLLGHFTSYTLVVRAGQCVVKNTVCTAPRPIAFDRTTALRRLHSDLRRNLSLPEPTRLTETAQAG